MAATQGDRGAAGTWFQPHAARAREDRSDDERATLFEHAADLPALRRRWHEAAEHLGASAAAGGLLRAPSAC